MSLHRRLAAALALALLSACSGDTEDKQPPPPQIPLSASAESVKADGVSTVKIQVARTDGIDVIVKTPDGKFQESDGKLVTVPKGVGTVTLVTCRSRGEPTCAGDKTIEATSADRGSGSVEVAFLSMEACDNKRDDNGDRLVDCADPDCLAEPCKLTTPLVGNGVCQAGVSGAIVCGCATGAAEDCSNLVDDNCDGKIDCADPTCGNKECAIGAALGLCNANVCKCPNAAEVCTSAVDRDCDGLVRCDDDDCQSKAGLPGKVCDELGHTCSAKNGEGRSTCTVCPSGLSAEAQCGDGKDDDCDGRIDCEDPDCLDKTCAANGKACNAQLLCACAGNGAAAEATELTCDDRIDNDCDGKVDCADEHCRESGGRVCGPFGVRCTAQGACSCGALAENCATPVDDDCNGLANCQETACRPTGTVAGKVCDASGNTCSQIVGGASACDSCSGNGGVPEPTEGATGGASRTCGDGKDNDCDGTPALPSTDCQDPDCDGLLCNAFGGTCDFAAKKCGCPGGRSNETGACNDGVDNDCDGTIDCADPDCRPAPGIPAGACGTGNGFLCTGAGTCACSGGGGVAETVEGTAANARTCADGRDNDCDGVADCADTDCLPVGNGLGKVCDAGGNTCSNRVNGRSTCNVCSGNGGQVQQSEFACGDGKDNDCDGKADCQDPGCDTLACNASGKRCTGASLTCECPGPSTETNCGDAVDEDCDGAVDCLDPDCLPLNGNVAGSCSATGRFCAVVNNAGACTCRGNGGVVEAAEASCGDGKDNDCDGLVDCADANCRPATATATDGRVCTVTLEGVASVGRRCDFTGQCVCPGGQAAEGSCEDGQDNDCDGKVDCADPDCLNAVCSATGKKCGVTSSAGCLCPSGKLAEDACADGADDDCDGRIDCLDADCVDKACNAATPSTLENYRCKANICQDKTTQVSIVAAVARARIPADGAATTTITATLRDNGVLQPNRTVTFAVVDGPGTVVTTASTNQQGVASATFTAGAEGGVSTVRASYSSGTITVTSDVAVTQPKLQQIKFIGQQRSVMGVRFSSFQETNELVFQLLDVNGATYPAELAVSFTHTPAGGSYIGALPNCTSAVPPVCTATGTTDASGYVKVLLSSGTTQSVVTVLAESTAGGLSANATASNIAIVGAKASGRYISVKCGPTNVAALFDEDCSTSAVPATISCEASFADRFNNTLGVATLATFSSEAGAAGPPAYTPNYNPTAAPSAQTGLGKTTGTVSVGGFSLPRDVPPFEGEHRLTYDSGCGVKEHNPRDGVVTVIVSANGEEGFVDGSNGKPANGTYELGENFIDSGEPFVDANDNGTRDSNESYVDANTNGKWDGPNGVWDANTIVWAEERIVYTGLPIQGPYLSRWYNYGEDAPPYATYVGPATFDVISTATNAPKPATTMSAGVYFTDKFFNQPNHATVYNVTSFGPVLAAMSTNPAIVDNRGMNFTQQYCPAQASSEACTSTCSSAPCYRVIDLSGFALGTWGAVRITGGSNPGPASVRVTPVLRNVARPIDVFGTVH